MTTSEPPYTALHHQILTALAASDMSFDEIMYETQAPQTDVESSVDHLVQRGLVHSTHARDTVQYLSLTDEGWLHAEAPQRKASAVLFVCTANSARSQMAEALWRIHSPVPAESAGQAPGPRTAPATLSTLDRHGVAATGHAPQGFDDLSYTPDLVVAVCDNAYQGSLPYNAPVVHWSIPDPVEANEPTAFEDAFNELEQRIVRLSQHVHFTEE